MTSTKEDVFLVALLCLQNNWKSSGQCFIKLSGNVHNGSRNRSSFSFGDYQDHCLDLGIFFKDLLSMRDRAIWKCIFLQY